MRVYFVAVIDDLAARNELIAIAIIVAGVIVARLASIATAAVLGFLDRRAAQITTTEQGLITPQLIRVTRAIVFWLIVILAVSYALRVIGVGGVSTMLSTVIGFVPQLLVAFTIVVAGHVVGLVASHIVAELSDDVTTSSIGPRLLHGSILVIAIVMGLQHVDVDISFVTQLILMLVAIVGGGLMLAFALGARRHVANLLARRELSRLFIGDRIRVGDIEGEVVDIHATGVDVATDDGIASVPAALLAESAFVRKAGSEERD